MLRVWNIEKAFKEHTLNSHELVIKRDVYEQYTVCMVIFRGSYCHKYELEYLTVCFTLAFFEPVSLGQHGVNKACLTYIIQLWVR